MYLSTLRQSPHIRRRNQAVHGTDTRDAAVACEVDAAAAALQQEQQQLQCIVKANKDSTQEVSERERVRFALACKGVQLLTAAHSQGCP
jgi:hypothetical protein